MEKGDVVIHTDLMLTLGLFFASRDGVKVRPAANHLFIEAVGGEVSEYPTLEKVFVPGFLDDLVGFVRAVAPGPAR
jgi:hypothetical protein